MWHFGQKKNPARTAVIKRQTRTTIAVIAAGPTGLGRRGIVGLLVVGGEQYFIFLNGSRTETLWIRRIPLSSWEQLIPPMRQKCTFDSFINRIVSDSPVQFAHFTICSPFVVQVNPKDKLVLLVYKRLMISLQLFELTKETQKSLRCTTGGHFSESFEEVEFSFK